MNDQIRKILILNEKLKRPYGRLLESEPDVDVDIDSASDPDSIKVLPKQTRTLRSFDEFFDVLDKLGGNWFTCMGYVSGANLNVPQIKRRNPLTNRMKGYDDYSVFHREDEDEIGAILDLKVIKFRYKHRDTVDREYRDFKLKRNEIAKEYGVEPIKDKGDDSFTTTIRWGEHGIKAYNGDNKNKQGNSYSPQNVFGADYGDSVTYIINKEGHTIRKLTKDEVKPYIKAHAPITGVRALQKMGAEQSKIDEFVRRVKDLKMVYKLFESSSVVWMCATEKDTHERILYINDNLNRCINDININKEDFLEIARERYKDSLPQ